MTSAHFGFINFQYQRTKSLLRHKLKINETQTKNNKKHDNVNVVIAKFNNRSSQVFNKGKSIGQKCCQVFPSSRQRPRDLRATPSNLSTSVHVFPVYIFKCQHLESDFSLHILHALLHHCNIFLFISQKITLI